jgi:hypothetical protein
MLPEHLFAGIQTLQQRPGRSPGFVVARDLRRTSQWRDRAGFSPASLFSSLLYEAPERFVKNVGTVFPSDRKLSCSPRQSQSVLRKHYALK